MSHSEKIDCTDELKEIINSDIKKYLSSVRGNFEGIKITMEGDIND